jgi:hypothetical protein
MPSCILEIPKSQRPEVGARIVGFGHLGQKGVEAAEASVDDLREQMISTRVMPIGRLM